MVPKSTMNHIRISVLTSILLISSLVSAQDDERALGDHPLFDRFPDSALEEIEVIEDVNYRLVLGSLQRNRELVVPESSERLRGDVTKLTYQLTQGFSGEDAQQFFAEQIEEKAYEILYSCAGRSCGSSNYWANDIFRKRILYGPERNQYFAALRIPQADAAPAHASLYIITRANRRIYAYLEIIEENVSGGVVSLASPGLLETLNSRGAVSLPDIYFSEEDELSDESDLQAALELLNTNPDMNFYLVAHLVTAGDLEELLERSRARASALQARLLRAGIPASRIIVAGAGPLAPTCEISNCSERVELVLRVEESLAENPDDDSGSMTNEESGEAEEPL